MDPSAAAPVSTPARRSYSGIPDKMLTMNVSNYSATKKQVANGCSIKSPKFDAGGRSWRIIYYPNGMQPGTTESISLYLQLEDAGVDGDHTGDDDEDVEVQYQFMIPMSSESGIRFMSGKVVATFNRLDKNAHGFERFVTRDELEKSGCVMKEFDSFTIQCGVTVLSTTRSSVQAEEETSLV